MTKQSMGELIADLETLGYVERRADPGDRRARVVVLTEAGRRLDRLAGHVIREIEISYRRRMGDRRMDALLEGLAEIAKSPNDPGEGLRSRRKRHIDPAPA